MKAILLILLAISMILTIYVVYYFLNHGTCGAEGFEGGADAGAGETKNALVSLMGNLKRINGYLMDPKMWAERIETFGMNPVDIARRELNKQKASKTIISNEETE